MLENNIRLPQRTRPSSQKTNHKITKPLHFWRKRLNINEKQEHQFYFKNKYKKQNEYS